MLFKYGGISPKNKADESIAMEGLQAMEDYMKEIGLELSLKSLGVTDDMFEGIAHGTFILNGGYKTLTHNEIIDILKESM